jgi:F-type H+-transporting ATPase subunit delta
MIQGGLSRRYAKGLFLLALEGGGEEESGQQLGRLLAAYEKSPLASVLNNPAFELHDRRKVLLEVAKGFQLSPMVTHFLCLLLDRGRLPLLAAIFAHYRNLLDEAKGRVQARVVTASPLESSMLGRLRGALEKVSSKEIVLNAEIDPELIGGAVVEIEGKIYDGSIRTHLEKMKERLEKGS